MAHYFNLKQNIEHYYYAEYFENNLNQRVFELGKAKNFKKKNADYVHDILDNESEYFLNMKDLQKLDSLKNEYFNPVKKRKINSLSGGGIKSSPEFIVIQKDEVVLRLIFENNLKKSLENYLNEYDQYVNMQKDLSMKVKFTDIWIASITLFQFGDITPVSVSSKILYLIQTVISFLFVFMLSHELNRPFEKK